METFGLLLILLAYSVGSPVNENSLKTFSKPTQWVQDDPKSQTQGESLKNFVENVECKLKTKLDTLDTRINNVNHNMEMMKKKMDLISVNGNFVNQKIFNFEAGVNDKLEKMEESLKNKIDDVEKGVMAKLDNYGGGINDSKVLYLFKEPTVPPSGGQNNPFIELSKVPTPVYITWSKHIATKIGSQFAHFWKFLKEW